jgi:hypothetical protein
MIRRMTGKTIALAWVWSCHLLGGVVGTSPHARVAGRRQTYNYKSPNFPDIPKLALRAVLSPKCRQPDSTEVEASE